MSPARLSNVLVVDPTACDGHGVCAELFPEWITLDRWGYPMISGEAIPGNLAAHAERAVISCPRLALHLVARPTEVTRSSPAPERTRLSQPPDRQVTQSKRVEQRSEVRLVARSTSPAARPDRRSR
jgi:ferredoxin